MTKKKILIIGVGVQGSTVAKMLDAHDKIEEIICADRDENAVNGLVATLNKGRGIVIDCTDKQAVKKAAEGVDMIVNALPIPIMLPVLEVAAEAQVNYLDFNAPARSFGDDIFDGYGVYFRHFDKLFKEAGVVGMSNCGGAPGMINVAAKYTMRYLDSCDTIMILFNEGLRTKRFIPFWWDKETALRGMMLPPLAFVNGKGVMTKQYSDPIVRNWPELGRDTTFYEHAHPEPVHIGYHSKDQYKGVKNAYFKYAGAGIDFSKPLYDLGLLSMEPEVINGKEVVPFELIVDHLPDPPKFPEDIRQILDEGIVEENGAGVVESTGWKDGKPVLVEAHLTAPGIEECFARTGFSSEMYQTGMSGAIFSKLILDDIITEPGLQTGDTLSDYQVDKFFEYASEYGHGIEISIKRPIDEEHHIELYEG